LLQHLSQNIVTCANVQKLQLLGDFVSQTSYRSLAQDHTGSSLAASDNESLYFSLRLCFSNDVYSEPNSWTTRNQRHGFMAGWQMTFWSRFAFTDAIGAADSAPPDITDVFTGPTSKWRERWKGRVV